MQRASQNLFWIQSTTTTTHLIYSKIFPSQMITQLSIMSFNCAYSNVPTHAKSKGGAPRESNMSGAVICTTTHIYIEEAL